MLLQAVRQLIDAGHSSRVPAEELLDSVLPDIGNRAEKATAFWPLLVASAVISTIGVLMDSTATVIGAMVIAPLGTPIYGIAAGLVAGVSVRPVTERLLGGIAVVVAIGISIDLVLFDYYPIASNPQVLSRTNPSLPDLVVAIATGSAGALALVRRDISPALPGVAIAISLVPPLSVVGITIAHAEWTLAAGAALLFSTNLMAIVGAGLVVFSAARLAARTSEPRPRSRRAFWTLTTFSIIVVSALIGGTIKAAQLYGGTRNVQAAAQQWVDSTSGEWALQSVVRNGDVITVTVLGTGDAESASSTSVDEDTARLLKSLRSEDIDVDVQFVSGSRATIN